MFWPAQIQSTKLNPLLRRHSRTPVGSFFALALEIRQVRAWLSWLGRVALLQKLTSRNLPSKQLILRETSPALSASMVTSRSRTGWSVALVPPPFWRAPC